MTQSSQIAQVVKSVEALLQPVFDALEPVAGAVASTQRQRRAAGRRLEVSDLSALKQLIQTQLAPLDLSNGMGVLVAPNLLPDRERHVEWWLRLGDGFGPLRLNFDTSSVDLYDYLGMDWFTIPQYEDRRAVVGPYIDYTGADSYIFTLTVPIRDQGIFLGVAGADVPMSNLEPRLLRVLRALQADAVLVNGERCVLAANSSRWIVGSRLARLPEAGVGEFFAAAEVPGGGGWVVGLATRR